MKTFSLVYAEVRKQVWALILLPLLLTAIYIIILENFGYDLLPVWMSVIIFITIVALTMLWIMTRVVNVGVKVTITDEKLIFEPDRSNLLYPGKSFEVAMDNISQLTEDRSAQNNYRRYFNIRLKKPAKTIFLMQPKSVGDDVIGEFSALLHLKIESFNRKPGLPEGAGIREGSFYDAGWPKFITWLAYVMLVVLTIVLLTGYAVPCYKALQVYVLISAWLIAYHSGRSKKAKT